MLSRTKTWLAFAGCGLWLLGVMGCPLKKAEPAQRCPTFRCPEPPSFYAGPLTADLLQSGSKWVAQRYKTGQKEWKSWFPTLLQRIGAPTRTLVGTSDSNLGWHPFSKQDKANGSHTGYHWFVFHKGRAIADQDKKPMVVDTCFELAITVSPTGQVRSWSLRSRNVKPNSPEAEFRCKRGMPPPKSAMQTHSANSIW